MRGVGNNLLHDGLDLGQLAHEVDLIVQTASGVDNDHIGILGHGRLHCVESHRRGVGTLTLLNARYTYPIGPNLELADGGSTEDNAADEKDSAEFLFRKLLLKDKRINSQIAANKGLLEVYEKRVISDSIAKFAKVSYALNDSAYLLSEMENVQKLQASYNYEHAKLLAEQKSHESERAYLTIAIIVSLVIVAIVVAFYAFSNYRRKKEEELKQYRQDLYNLEKAQTELQELMAIETQNAASLIEKKNREILSLQESIEKHQKLNEKHVATLESRLDDADIVKHLHGLVDKNPPQIATQEDFRQLKMLVNEEIPIFYSSLNTPECSLRTIEYEVCLLIRCHFLPSEICKLTGRNESYISNLRKAILLKLYGVKGAPKDLDQRIMAVK